jgi:hypothetical protein
LPATGEPSDAQSPRARNSYVPSTSLNVSLSGVDGSVSAIGVTRASY